MALVNLFTVQHTNPGAVPLGARPLPIAPDELDDKDDDQDQSSLLEGQINASRTRRRGIRRCRKCNNNYKPPRSHHDSVTGRCVVKFDHFCPWAGNAIGALNHKFFFLFILYTFFTSITSLFIIILRFVQCGYEINSEQVVPNEGAGDAMGMGPSASTTTIHEYYTINSNETSIPITNETQHFRFLDEDLDTDDSYHYKYEGCHELYSPRVILLLLMSIAFMIFTCCMLVEQIDAIESNTSKIARMKIAMGQNQNGEYDRKTEQCNEMFGIGMDMGGCIRCDRGGSHVALHWFLPTPVRFPEGKLDMVLGFEYKEEWYGKIYQESMDYEDEEEGGGHNGVGGSDAQVDHPLEVERAELGASSDSHLDLDMAEKRSRGRSLLPAPSSSSSRSSSLVAAAGKMTKSKQRQPKEIALEMNKVVEMKRVSSTRSSSSTISKRSGGGVSGGGTKEASKLIDEAKIV